jgi:hypothetical protein
MPVPPHLTPIQGIPVVNNTSYRQKLEALPGGYGQWYCAPRFGPKREFGFRKAAAIVFLVGGVATVGVLSLGFLSEIRKDKERFENEQRQQKADNLEERVDPKRGDLKLIYGQMDREFANGVNVVNVNSGAPLKRIELAPAVTAELSKLAAQWKQDLASDLVKNTAPKSPAEKKDLDTARALIAGAPLALVNIEADKADEQLAANIEHDFKLEPSWAKLITGEPNDAQRKQVREMFAGISEPAALHRELGARLARENAHPAILAVFWIEHAENGAKVLSLRLVYPGREARYNFPIAE